MKVKPFDVPMSGSIGNDLPAETSSLKLRPVIISHLWVLFSHKSFTNARHIRTYDQYGYMYVLIKRNSF
jgi:hypothetical protein